MLKNRLFMYAILALSQSVFAAQSPRAGSPAKQVPHPLTHKSTVPQVNASKVACIYDRNLPLRSRSKIYTRIVYEVETLQEGANSPPMVTDKQGRGLMSGMYCDHHDNLSCTGRSNYAFTCTAENIDKPTLTLQPFGKAATQHNVTNKPVFGHIRQPSKPKLISFYASVSGQFASRNLDVSERMEQDGGYGARAYPEGASPANEGYVLNLEARIQLPKLFERQQVESQLIGFVDTGSMTVNRRTWVDGLNSRALNGVGVGVNFSYINNFEVKAYYANKLGSDDVATSTPDASGHIWIVALKYF